jgi:hypothetical protein
MDAGRASCVVGVARLFGFVRSSSAFAIAIHSMSKLELPVVEAIPECAWREATGSSRNLEDAERSVRHGKTRSTT